MATITISDLLNLSPAERIQLAQDLWDSIAAQPDWIPLTDEQREELDARLADAEANPGKGRSWAEVKERLLHGG